MAFNGDFTPVLAKHSKNFSLKNAIEIAISDMQRNFQPMVQAVERWQGLQLTDVSAKMIIYRAFVEGDLEVPHHPDRKVHELYFNPQYDEFSAANDVVTVECVYQRAQRTRTGTPVSDHSEARRLPRKRSLNHRSGATDTRIAPISSAASTKVA